MAPPRKVLAKWMTQILLVNSVAIQLIPALDQTSNINYISKCIFSLENLSSWKLIQHVRKETHDNGKKKKTVQEKELNSFS